jgi:hypothetical protein
MNLNFSSRFTRLMLPIALAFACHCGALTSLIGGASSNPQVPRDVQMIYAEGDKRVLVVRPPAIAATCTMQVQGRTPSLDCQAEYVVTCNANLPTKKPLCSLAVEQVVSRESVYPTEVGR